MQMNKTEPKMTSKKLFSRFSLITNQSLHAECSQHLEQLSRAGVDQMLGNMFKRPIRTLSTPLMGLDFGIRVNSGNFTIRRHGQTTIEFRRRFKNNRQGKRQNQNTLV